MDDILIVNETDLRLQVALDHDAVNVVEAAFDALQVRVQQTPLGALQRNSMGLFLSRVYPHMWD